MNNNGSVKITNREIYDELLKLKSTVEVFMASIEEKMTPEFRLGSCPYKKTINGLWKNIGILVGIAAILGGILGGILFRIL